MLKVLPSDSSDNQAATGPLSEDGIDDNPTLASNNLLIGSRTLFDGQECRFRGWDRPSEGSDTLNRYFYLPYP